MERILLQTIKLEGILTCLAPLHHGGNEKTGSTIGFRRIEMITKEGIEEVPLVEGNAIRGRLRRVVMKDFLDRIQYTPQTPRLYHFFYSGGALEQVESRDVGTLNLELRRKIRLLMPPISIFGTSYLNQAFSGKLKVMKAFPICKELEGITFQKNSDNDDEYGQLFSFHQLISETFQTRRDELRADREKDEQATQMLIEYEVLIPGTKLSHSFVLEDTNPVEEACFHHLLQLWVENPFVGGKSNIGFGELRANYNQQIIQTLEPIETYFSFIDQNQEKITELLKRMDQTSGMDTKGLDLDA